MSHPEVVIYGANGYTGKQTAIRLAKRGIPFIAAGRNAQKIREALSRLPELKEARYEVEEVRHEEAALTRLLTGKRVIYNLVGPYMQMAEPVVRAALTAGLHYFDATGEQDWMLHLKQHYHALFEAKGLVLSPALAVMWNSGVLVGELVLQRPGIDSIDLVYAATVVPSVGSTLSFMRMCCQPNRYLSQGKLVRWPDATMLKVAVPGVDRVMTALPWGGGGESIFFEGDPRVKNCTTLVAVANEALVHLVHARMSEFSKQYAHLPIAEQEEITNKWAREVAPQGEPEVENPDVHRSILVCNGRGATSGYSVAVYAAGGYAATSIMAAESVQAVLDRPVSRAGFQAGVYVTGPQRMFDALKEAGVLGDAAEVIR